MLPTLKDTVIHSLSDQFLSDEEFQMVGKEDIAMDDYNNTSFALFSSMLVLRSFIPCMGEKSKNN